MCVVLSLIVFFFNDTATTEIYTLSLHDALPISAGIVVCIPQDDSLATWEPAIQDRKSTRLNSSHLGISYAVFCLKKKTGAFPPVQGSQLSSNGANYVEGNGGREVYNNFLLDGFFFFNDTATTEIFPLSLHSALPI